MADLFFRQDLQDLTGFKRRLRRLTWKWRRSRHETILLNLVNPV